MHLCKAPVEINISFPVFPFLSTPNTHTVKSCHYLHTRHLENVLGDPILPCHPHSLSLSFFLPFSSGFPFVFFTLVFTPMAFSSLSPWLSLSLSLSRPVLHPVWHTHIQSYTIHTLLSFPLVGASISLRWQMLMMAAVDNPESWAWYQAELTLAMITTSVGSSRRVPAQRGGAADPRHTRLQEEDELTSGSHRPTRPVSLHPRRVL